MCTVSIFPISLREEEAIKLDGLSVAEMKELREKAEKFVYQVEVNRMMKLIINSLYRNKEVCLFVTVSLHVYKVYLDMYNCVVFID